MFCRQLYLPRWLFAAQSEMCVYVQKRKKQKKYDCNERMFLIYYYLSAVIIGMNVCIGQHHQVCTNGRLGWRERQIVAQRWNIMRKFSCDGTLGGGGGEIKGK